MGDNKIIIYQCGGGRGGKGVQEPNKGRVFMGLTRKQQVGVANMIGRVLPLTPAQKKTIREQLGPEERRPALQALQVRLPEKKAEEQRESERKEHRDVEFK